MLPERYVTAPEADPQGVKDAGDARREPSKRAMGLSLHPGFWLLVFVTIIVEAGLVAYADQVPTIEEREASGPVLAVLDITARDADSDGLMDVIKLTLLSTHGAAYRARDIVILGEAGPDGVGNAGGRFSLLDACITAPVAGRCAPFDVTRDTWAAGESIFVPCITASAHQLRLVLREHVVHDGMVACQEPGVARG